MKKLSALILLITVLSPTLVMAHPGHHHHDASFWTGFIHPFTGLDHLMMALSFGVLMWTVSKQWKLVGAWALVTVLVAGFALGAQGVLAGAVAEYGILASLVVLAIALWTQSNRVLPVAAMVLATFHGVAHGAELAANGNVAVQILGMISAMAVIYAVGLGLGALISKHVPHGKKVLGTITAIVAGIGLV